MLQIEDRAWVEQALKFWTSRKPDRHTPRRIIDWNVEQLTAAMKRLDAPQSTLTPSFDDWLVEEAHAFLRFQVQEINAERVARGQPPLPEIKPLGGMR